MDAGKAVEGSLRCSLYYHAGHLEKGVGFVLCGVSQVSDTPAARERRIFRPKTKEGADLAKGLGEGEI